MVAARLGRLVGLALSMATECVAFSYKPGRAALYGEDCEARVEFVAGDFGGSVGRGAPCWSGLAREDGGTFDIDAVGLPLSRASSLPQGIAVSISFLCMPQNQCGSGLARDGGGTVSIDVA
ncbi:Hypothetical protein PSEBR_m1565 [Pseudomonas brassicacearum subsp. brassicacearum NFM421]|uniref:Uncharacterized protein n=1 Tax=Pseudomonas brassicacearum (strain NFM421) TaxID=994484 RepID=F2KLM0_PSEBN|nr:Hypothetical protein PSEBR_m1565 [Pseudomonas brassicacearum subsp. brassicacearum NFM421]